MSKYILYSMTIVGLALLSACGDGEKKSRGLDYMPEMYNTPAYKSQQVIELVDGTSTRHVPAMLPPPAGTVARGGAAYDIAPLDFESAKKLVNPLVPDGMTLKGGQKNFNVYCATCHGLDGNSANGYVAATKDHPNRFGGVPSINTPNVAKMSDGEIYHIITVGRNRMPNYCAQLLPQNRWQVVTYLRVLDRATLALSDVAAELAKKEQAEVEGGNKVESYDKAELDTLRALVKQRQLDLDLIRKGGDGADFAPVPSPVPEYIIPTWTEK